MKSKAQRAYLHIHEPDVADEFEKSTPKGKKLPGHVGESVAPGQVLKFNSLATQQHEAMEGHAGKVGAEAFIFTWTNGKIHADLDGQNPKAMQALKTGDIEKDHLIWDKKAMSDYTGEPGDWVEAKQMESTAKLKEFFCVTEELDVKKLHEPEDFAKEANEFIVQMSAELEALKSFADSKREDNKISSKARAYMRTSGDVINDIIAGMDKLKEYTLKLADIVHAEKSTEQWKSASAADGTGKTFKKA